MTVSYKATTIGPIRRAATAALALGAAAAAAAAATGASAFTSGYTARSASRATATSVRAGQVEAPVARGGGGQDSASSSSSSSPSSSSPLRMICDEQKEFEIALGRAVDTLKKDYPGILKANPDFSIYHEKLETVDPSGVKIHGLRSYKTSFRFLHAFINFFYCPGESGLTFRLVYDWARNQIRISWNVILVPKAIYGGVRNMLHVDGISVYEVQRSSGLITQHRIEKLMLNDRPVRPVNGIFNALSNELVRANPEGVPALNAEGNTNPFTLEFHTKDVLSNLIGPSGKESSLFSSASGTADSKGDNGGFDQKAFESKNRARKKFGLAPLTPQEFEELQVQVRQLEMAQRQKAAASTSAAQLANQQQKKKNLFEKFLGGVLEDTCQDNWDCERPEVCCDFGFKKMCCASGIGVYNGAPGQRALLRVPVEIGDGPMAPDALYN